MELQVVEHRLGEGESCQLQAGHRVVYSVAENSASYSSDALRLEGPLHALCFELVPEASDEATLSAPVPSEAGDGWLIRCDRVDFPPGGVAYLHTHQGPGIRVLLHGTIRIETGGREQDYAPLQAWFEPGPEPVFAAASESEPTAFVRCMVLPAHLHGKSSIHYVRDEDASKPKSQRYQVFIDEPLTDLAVSP